MKNIWWFCLLTISASCQPPASNSEWDGKYIGYYHRNKKDTTLVKIIFSGKFFAVAPHYDLEGVAAEGVFEQQPSALVFHHVSAGPSSLLHGRYQYQFSADGAVRLWQKSDADYREIILRQQ